MKQKIAEFIVKRVLRARWIVDSENCLGLRIGGVNLIYYKWPDPTVSFEPGWRFARKREFGESVAPRPERNPSLSDLAREVCRQHGISEEEMRLRVLHERDLMGLPR